MKKCIYIGCLCDENTYTQVFSGANKPMQAASKYHRLLCEGLAANDISVCAYSVLPVNRANCSKYIINARTVRTNGVQAEYPLIVNLPGVKHLLLLLQCFFKVLFAPSDTVVFYDCLVISASYGACLAAMIRGFKRVSIVTDLPEFMDISVNKAGKTINNKLLGLCTGFLFLTKQMNDKVNFQHKPYIVLEGHVDQNMDALEHKSFERNERKVIYAGGLSVEYGIKTLCEAFINIAKSNEVLHIYGDGPYREELSQICAEHSNILFQGNVLNTQVVEAELDAALLVNPRPTDGEFTKYSFPSKTMEYMVSGTPVATTKLPGIPEEYCDYVYILGDGAESMGAKLREILDMSSEQLRDFGANAREFVLRNKNNKKQAHKLIAFVEGL